MTLYLALFEASLSSPVMWLALALAVALVAVGCWREFAR